MINHTVLFKINDYPSETKKQIAKELTDKLLELKNKIKEIEYLEVNTSIDIEDNNYDIALFVHVKDEKNLDIYRQHPDHQKVVKRILEVTSARAAVDFIVN